MINPVSQKLRGWYFYQFSYMMMFIFGVLGISDQLKTHLVLEWSNIGPLIILSTLSLIGLFQTITVPMVKIATRRVYLYKYPSFFTNPYNFLIDDLEKIELIKGSFRWKITIKLSNGKEINYSPSPLETDLNRIIIFIERFKHNN